MHIFLKKQRSKIKQRIKVKNNINRSITYGENKIIMKIQNTNNHIYIRVINIPDRKVLCTFSTIKYSKQKYENITYKMQMIKFMVDDLIKELLKLDILSKINKSSIIWDMSGGAYRGRIKALIDEVNNKLEVELNK